MLRGRCPPGPTEREPWKPPAVQMGRSGAMGLDLGWDGMHGGFPSWGRGLALFAGHAQVAGLAAGWQERPARCGREADPTG